MSSMFNYNAYQSNRIYIRLKCLKNKCSVEKSSPYVICSTHGSLVIGKIEQGKNGKNLYSIMTMMLKVLEIILCYLKITLRNKISMMVKIVNI